MSKIDLVIHSQPNATLGVTSATQNVRLRLYALLLIADTISIILSFGMAANLRSTYWISEAGLNLAFMVIPIYTVFAFTNQAYALRALQSGSASARSAVLSLMATLLVVFTVGFALHATENVSRLAFSLAMFVSAVLIVTHRQLVRRYVRRVHGTSLSRDLMILDGDYIVESTPHSHVIAARQALIEPNLNDPLMLHRLGMILQNYDRAIIACPQERRGDWALLLKGANITGEIIIPSLGDLGAIGVSAYGTNPTAVVARGPLALANRAKKRALDIALTVPVLVALTPLMIIVAIAIRLDSAGPVFFKQDRIGRGNRIFKILKFRSMRVEKCDAGGALSTQRDDDRITRVGRIIRSTSIDELPQLINVLLGDMSLVGPRPHALGSLAGDKLFWEVDRQYWHRHALKPGITGLAQVRGFRGATNHHKDLQDRLNADLEYLEGWNIWRDISIIAGTAMVLVHKNAF